MAFEFKKMMCDSSHSFQISVPFWVVDKTSRGPSIFWRYLQYAVWQAARQLKWKLKNSFLLTQEFGYSIHFPVLWKKVPRFTK